MEDLTITEEGGGEGGGGGGGGGGGERWLVDMLASPQVKTGKKHGLVQWIANKVTDLIEWPGFETPIQPGQGLQWFLGTSAGTSQAQARADHKRAQARARELLADEPNKPSLQHFTHSTFEQMLAAFSSKSHWKMLT